MSTPRFNYICNLAYDGFYDPEFPPESQCTGYKELVRMIRLGIDPTPKEEVERYEKNPTPEELFSVPPLGHLRFLHFKMRDHIRENWDTIREAILMDVKFKKIR